MSNAPERQAALRLTSASVHRGERAILSDVDLSIGAGERVVLIGPSGAGKTTLLRLFGAALWADSGQVEALGEDPTKLRGRALRRHRHRIGFLRQSQNLIAPLRVAHNVLMGQLGRWSTARSLLNLFWPRDLDRARDALRQVEMEDRLWALPEELSGGEQQRVALARLIVQQPEVILADEPVSALDVRLGAQVIDLLIGLARDRGATLLVSLHSLDLIHRGFDRVVAMRDGGIVWEGPPAELDDELLRQVYGSEYDGLVSAEPAQG